MKETYTAKEVADLILKYTTQLNKNEFVTVPYYGRQHSLFNIKNSIAKDFLYDEGVIKQVTPKSI